MGLAAYQIIGHDAEWRVRHDGKAENIYETKEAAFEAAVAAASLALRQGHEIRVTRTGARPCQRIDDRKTLSIRLSGALAWMSEETAESKFIS
jgi:hypothetical protein